MLMRAHDHTFAYADAIRCSVTALLTTYTEAKKKVCIYVHLLITKYFLFYEENLSLNGI